MISILPLITSGQNVIQGTFKFNPPWSSHAPSANILIAKYQINTLINGGLCSGLTYGGAATIVELQRKLDYIEITTSGRTESFMHGLL